METSGNERHMATSGAGGRLNPAASPAGSRDGEHKEIPTVVTAKYTGDYKTAANQAGAKRPDNPDEVIARNTTYKCCRCGR